MLDQTDIDRVSAYIYEGFPQIKGRVAVRRFDPPMELQFLNGVHYDEALDRCKPKIREDYLSQFAEGRERTDAGYALNAAMNGDTGMLGPMRARDFVQRSMHRSPSAGELTTEFDKCAISTGYYYIAQYPSQMMDDKKMMQNWVGNDAMYRAPQGFARIAGMFALAHEFAHIAGDGLFKTGDRRVESLCDAVASACVLSLEGPHRAKHALSILRDGRLSAETGSSHDTGIFMLHLLGDKAFPGKLNVKEALGHAERLYDRMYPAEITQKAEPAPAF
jgi:hypothetical protein